VIFQQRQKISRSSLIGWVRRGLAIVTATLKHSLRGHSKVKEEENSFREKLDCGTNWKNVGQKEETDTLFLC